MFNTLADGLGVDIVHIPAFADQLRAPGTRFTSVFSATELRTARRRAGATGTLNHHLAARWARQRGLHQGLVLGPPRPASRHRARPRRFF
ncbi:hypothetical protein [Trueperella pyogenes]|uniref:hypothetical protein n=1 Tax=Trueperella pyogenes TaxID=1661 RepID=UPI003DA85D7A